MIRGGDNGNVVGTNGGQASPILERIQSDDPQVRMPPEGEPLTESERGLFKDWIGRGVVAIPDEQPEKDPRDHWAFQKPTRSELPKTDNSEWQSNPIDAFISQQHRAMGLVAQPEIEKIVMASASFHRVGRATAKQNRDGKFSCGYLSGCCYPYC